MNRNFADGLLALAPPWRGLLFVEPIPASRIALLRNPHFRAHEVSLCARPRPLQSEGGAFLCHEIAVIGGKVWSPPADQGAGHEEIDERGAAKEGSQL
jgi:hypothetical protein